MPVSNASASSFTPGSSSTASEVSTASVSSATYSPSVSSSASTPPVSSEPYTSPKIPPGEYMDSTCDAMLEYISSSCNDSHSRRKLTFSCASLPFSFTRCSSWCRTCSASGSDPPGSCDSW